MTHLTVSLNERWRENSTAITVPAIEEIRLMYAEELEKKRSLHSISARTCYNFHKFISTVNFNMNGNVF